jgi:hypothetical protein
LRFLALNCSANDDGAFQDNSNVETKRQTRKVRDTNEGQKIKEEHENHPTADIVKAKRKQQQKAQTQEKKEEKKQNTATYRPISMIRWWLFLQPKVKPYFSEPTFC